MKPRNHWLRCDHPRTPKNTTLCGRKPRCKICYRAYKARYDAQRTGRPRRVPRVRRQPTPLPAAAAAIALYRTEKAKRTYEPSPALLQAKQEFAAMLKREELAGRGGRPKGAKTVNSLKGKLAKPGKPMIVAVRTAARDALLEAVQPFYGSGAA